MNELLKNIIRFILFILVQVFILFKMPLIDTARPSTRPKGMFTTAHFHVIQLASARTSSSETLGA